MYRALVVLGTLLERDASLRDIADGLEVPALVKRAVDALDATGAKSKEIGEAADEVLSLFTPH